MRDAFLAAARPPADEPPQRRPTAAEISELAASFGMSRAQARDRLLDYGSPKDYAAALDNPPELPAGASPEEIAEIEALEAAVSLRAADRNRALRDKFFAVWAHAATQLIGLTGAEPDERQVAERIASRPELRIMAGLDWDASEPILRLRAEFIADDDAFDASLFRRDSGDDDDLPPLDGDQDEQ